MTTQFDAAYQIHQFLSKRSVPYAIIGGLAVQYWGEPRLTVDVDVTVLVPPEKVDKWLSDLLKTFPSRQSDPIGFARKNRLVQLKSKDGCELDISLGVFGYEEQVVARAVDYDLGGGRKVKLCSAEDLIIHKAVAGRPQDSLDIEGIIERQGERLDTNYILRWLKEFANVLETDEVLERFTKPWKKFAKNS